MVIEVDGGVGGRSEHGRRQVGRGGGGEDWRALGGVAMGGQGCGRRGRCVRVDGGFVFALAVWMCGAVAIVVEEGGRGAAGPGRVLLRAAEGCGRVVCSCGRSAEASAWTVSL